MCPEKIVLLQSQTTLYIIVKVQSRLELYIYICFFGIFRACLDAWLNLDIAVKKTFFPFTRGLYGDPHCGQQGFVLLCMSVSYLEQF